MISTQMFWLLFGCAFVTWLPRVLPFIVIRNMNLPSVVTRWLTYIPVCILSALVISSLFTKDQEIVTINWQLFLAFIPTVFIAIVTKSLSLTVILGVITMALVRYFL